MNAYPIVWCQLRRAVGKRATILTVDARIQSGPWLLLVPRTHEHLEVVEARGHRIRVKRAVGTMQAKPMKRDDDILILGAIWGDPEEDLENATLGDWPGEAP